MKTAILEVNSRPLPPLTNTIDAKGGVVSQRWKEIFEIKQRLWHRWFSEYLSELQLRYKWKQRYENIKPGILVGLKADDKPVLK